MTVLERRRGRRKYRRKKKRRLLKVGRGLESEEVVGSLQRATKLAQTLVCWEDPRLTKVSGTSSHAIIYSGIPVTRSISPKFVSLFEK